MISSFNQLLAIVWMLVSTTFASVLVADLALIVFSWFKLSDHFYKMRFGVKKSFGLGTPRDRRVVVDSQNLSKDLTQKMNRS
jgi:hypothetical protein